MATQPKRLAILWLVLVLALAACGGRGEQAAPTPTAAPAATEATSTNDDAQTGAATRLVLATTTSTDDSGLLDALLPVFEEAYNAEVDVVAVGTGQALELGANGDADVLLVHAREREDAFVAEGNGTARYDVMYNDFVIVGPADDPAAIAEAESAADAFSRIAEAGATFVSRGDDSGTHIKEQATWEAAGLTPEGDWYQSAGQGMGAVLTLANEQNAYTISDRGTFASRDPEGFELVVLFEGDAILSNPYGVIPVNPEKHPDVNAELAQQFVDWLVSTETQALINNYQVNGQQLFFADSEAYRAAQGE